MKIAKTLLVAICLSVAAGANAEDTLKKIKDSGKITMGIRESSAPLSYLDAAQQPIGYHIDICKAIIEDIKKKIGTPALKTEIQAVTSQNRIPLMTNGTIDIECGSTTNSVARQKQVAFAYTTFVSNVRMAVKKPSGITSISQLDGKPVATTQGTTSVALMRANEKAKNVDFKEVYGKDHADSFLMLETDRAVAFVMDDNLLAGLIANSKSPLLFSIVGETLSTEPIGIMMRKDDPEFKKVADETIARMMKSGEIDKLYAKWFMSKVPPKDVSLNFEMSPELKALIKNPNDKGI